MFCFCWVTCHHFVPRLDLCLHFRLHFLSGGSPAPGGPVVFTAAAAASAGRHHIPGIAHSECCLEIQRQASVQECLPHRVPLSLWSPASSHFIWVSYFKPMLSALLLLWLHRGGNTHMHKPHWTTNNPSPIFNLVGLRDTACRAEWNQADNLHICYVVLCLCEDDGYYIHFSHTVQLHLFM